MCQINTRLLLYGKTPFFLFNWSLGSVTARPLIRTGLKKTNQCTAAAREPMAMQPAIAHQNRRGVWLFKWPLRCRISDFFSSAMKTLPRWLFADNEICRWNTSAAGLDLLQIRPITEQISEWRCCKFCAVIVRRAGLPCTLMTITLMACHTWGNPKLMLRSAGADCSHWEFNLASLCLWIAFFSESDSALRAPRFLPREKTAGRGFEQLVTSKLMSAQCQHVSQSPQRERVFARPLHSTWSASLCGCERYDLVRCEWRRNG